MYKIGIKRNTFWKLQINNKENKIFTYQRKSKKNNI